MIHDNLIGSYLLPDYLDGQSTSSSFSRFCLIYCNMYQQMFEAACSSSTTEPQFIFPGINKTTKTLPFRTDEFAAEGQSLRLAGLTICLAQIFFLWRQLKGVVNETLEDLVAVQTFVICQEYSNIVQGSMHRRCEACIEAVGRSFEHLLLLRVLCLHIVVLGLHIVDLGLYYILYFCEASTLLRPTVCSPTPYCIVKVVCFGKIYYPLQYKPFVLQHPVYNVYMNQKCKP